MSEKSPIIQIRLPVRFLRKLDAIIADLNKKSSARPWTRSSWVRYAIEMQMTIHDERQKSRGPNRHKCKTCGKMKSIEKISHTLTDLYGDRESYCKECHPEQLGKNPSPPM